jgi:hypothetical protein
MDFFIRDGDEQRAQQAVFMDDIDLIYSEKSIGSWGPSLVAVAVRHVDGLAVHVCQCCGEPFDDADSKYRSAEVRMGSAIMKLHARCASGERKSSFRSFADVVRGMQSRRFFAKATDPVARAAGED